MRAANISPTRGAAADIEFGCTERYMPQTTTAFWAAVELEYVTPGIDIQLFELSEVVAIKLTSWLKLGTC
jgi:hypothetical protein